MRVVKTRLLEMLPDATGHVFLDVDDLKEGRGASDVDRSQVVLVFVSSGYFSSQNCMRELMRAVVTQKPMVCLMEPEPARGGMTREQVRASLEAADAKCIEWGLNDEVAAWGYPMLKAKQLRIALYANEAIEWK